MTLANKTEMLKEVDRDLLRYYINKFCINENLFDLVEAMRIGANILEQEEFPMKEFSIYKYKYRRYDKN